MKEFFIEVFGVVLMAVLLFLLVLAITFPASWLSAKHKAEIWNRCNPEVQITTAEAFWSSPDITVCSKEISVE